MPDRPAPRAVVLGSVHMDLIASAARLPGPGESVGDGNFTMAPGGKGGNQACQFVLAGGQAHILTRLGDDPFGRQLLDALTAKNIDTGLVAVDLEFPTGASTVFAAQGDYSSIIAPGAAAHLSAADIETARDKIEDADALLLQLEVPADVSTIAAAIAAKRGKVVILNASPAPASWSDVPDALWRATSILVVNRVEAEGLLGRALSPDDLEADLAKLASRLRIETVVVTLGPDGAIALSNKQLFRQPAFTTNVTDTVGAGDAFLGALSVALLEGCAIEEGLSRGAAAGALALSRPGAWAALPSRKEIDRFLRDRGEPC